MTGEREGLGTVRHAPPRRGSLAQSASLARQGLGGGSSRSPSALGSAEAWLRRSRRARAQAVGRRWSGRTAGAEGQPLPGTVAARPPGRASGLAARLLATTCLFLLSSSVPAWAENGSDYAVEVSTKLGRGVLNLVSSPLELPCTMGDEISERGGAGAVTGLFKGLAFFLRRALVGATEIGTFVIPMEATLPSVCAKKPEARVE